LELRDAIRRDDRIDRLCRFDQNRMDAWFEDGEQIFTREDAISLVWENPFIDWFLRETWEACLLAS